MVWLLSLHRILCRYGLGAISFRNLLSPLDKTQTLCLNANDLERDAKVMDVVEAYMHEVCSQPGNDVLALLYGW